MKLFSTPFVFVPSIKLEPENVIFSESTETEFPSEHEADQMMSSATIELDPEAGVI